MSLIEKFSRMISQTNDSFVLEVGKNGNSSCFFVQTNVGTAKFVYGEDGHGKNWNTNIDVRLKLKAIVANENIYIVDGCVFGISSWTGRNETLPQNVYSITDIVKKENEWIRRMIFPDFYHSLVVREFQEEEDLARALKTAREVQLFALDNDVNLIVKPIMTEQDIVDSLCGLFDLGEEALRRLDHDRDKWCYIKSLNCTVKKLINETKVAEPYEIQIAEGIKNLDAKMVTIEFECNRKYGIAKIDRKSLMRKLIEKSHFSDYELEISQYDKELLKNMVTESEDGKTGNVHMLSCKDISRIIYRKKEVYIRK